MTSSGPCPSGWPSGLVVLPNVLTPEREADLLRALDSSVWDTTLSRRTQHYVTKYDYKSRDARVAAPPMLPEIARIAERLVHYNLFQTLPDQVIVNEYTRKQGISAHTDALKVFGNTVVSVSLGSEAVMIFRHPVHCPEGVQVLLAPRSAVIMQGAARYEWTHEIPSTVSYTVNGVKRTRPNDFRRVSVTFRQRV